MYKILLKQQKHIRKTNFKILWLYKLLIIFLLINNRICDEISRKKDI